MANIKIEKKTILTGIFIVAIVLSPVLYNVIVIRPRIYYIIDYDVDLPNQEEIIHKAENLNYSAYLDLKYCDPYRNISCYVDSDLVNFLKSRIVNDNGFKWWPFYAHHLRYCFLADNHSKLYLTYNNYTILSIKDQNNQLLFSREEPRRCELDWYMNFTQIPYVYSDNSTFEFIDCIFVEINLEYLWLCGYICEHNHFFVQYLILAENLDVLLILLCYDLFID
ncbi:MAG: hypothetical protein ACFFDB_14675 [Promethearchaeota archaeon]